MSTLMAGEGPRTFSRSENITAASEVPAGLAFLRGFTFNSTADSFFMVKVTLTPSLTSFELRIATFSKCYISAVQVDILLYYESKLAEKYVFEGSS